MKKHLLLLSFILFTGFTASAQKYRTNAGIRFGRNDFGVSLQQKIFEQVTLQGIVAAGNRDIDGTLLIEKHFPLIGKGFNYYIGAGVHAGSLKEYGGYYGADVILGSEIKLPVFPLVLSVDIKPAVHVGHEDWITLDGGFTLRYILVKEKVEKKRFGIFNRGRDNDRGRGNDRNDRNRNRNNKQEEPKRRILNW